MDRDSSYLKGMHEGYKITASCSTLWPFALFYKCRYIGGFKTEEAAVDYAREHNRARLDHKQTRMT